jgi:hypothetical protein
MVPILRALAALAALVLLLPVAAPPVVAQAVRGDLRDADRDRLLPGARLLLLNEAGAAVDSTHTDRAGRFHLTAPHAGSYTIYFRVDGWAGVPSDPIRLAEGATTDYEFRPPLVATTAIRQMSDVLGMEPRLQQALPEICGEPFRGWEAGLLVGVVRRRASGAPVPGALVAVAAAAGPVVRSTFASENGVYVLCNVPVGSAVTITIEAPDGASETTDVEIRAGTASWYDLPIGPRRR